MELGAFSVSLAVKDLNASLAFYLALGFEPVGGDVAQGWQIVRNGPTTIGLFQGMFDNNLMTFNPGWLQDGSDAPTYTDIRDIETKLREAGLTFQTDPIDSGEGPASFMITDPDGNHILVDQHR